MRISAHELCTTRLCSAVDCPNEAEPYQRLCWSCQRKDANTLRLHVTPPAGVPMLWCSYCRTDKPDTQFSLLSEVRLNHGGGRPTARRGRYYACKTCEPKVQAKEKKRT